MFIKKRIIDLLGSNDCRGAFNACDELTDYCYDLNDFNNLKGWEENGVEFELVSSNDAMFLFEDGIITGVSIYCKGAVGIVNTALFETVRGPGSYHTGALLDGFL